MAGTSNNSLEHLTNVYQNVMDDVVRNVREEFLNDAVDLEVLEDLRRMWLERLNQSGAVRRPPVAEPPPRLPEPRSRPHPQLPSSSASKQTSLPPPLVPTPTSSERVLPGPPSLISAHSLPDHTLPGRGPAHSDSVTVIHHAPAKSQSTTITSSTQQMPSTIVIPQGQGGGDSRVTSTTVPSLLQPSLSAFQQGIVPVQTPQGTFMVPLSHLMALQGQNQTPPTSQPSQNVQQTDGYPPSTATTRPPNNKTLTGPLHKRTTQELGSAPTPVLERSSTSSPGSISKPKRKKGSPKRGKSRRKRLPRPGDIVEFVFGGESELDSSRCAVIPDVGLGGYSRAEGVGGEGVIRQLDGADSSSDDDSDVDDDSSEDDIGGTEEVQDDSPLNSDDDVDDDVEEQKDFDTNDTIVCLWEKVYRVRTKWKFLLKDGIMHLGGYDYVFQKGTGEADW